MGGESGNYGLSNQSDAETVAEDVWAMFGPAQKDTPARVHWVMSSSTDLILIIHVSRLVKVQSTRSIEGVIVQICRATLEARHRCIGKVVAAFQSSCLAEQI